MIKNLCILFLLINVSFALDNLDGGIFYYQTINDTIMADTVKTLPDTVVSEQKIDTIQIFELQDFNTLSDRVINKNEYQKTDYRIPADYISLIKYGYKRYFGVLGQPDELILYGFGNSNIGYLENGLPLNNSINHTLNLYDFQSEYIDSVEIISLSRSFIYNNNNSPVSINFMTRNSIESVPYTRIRILQGPDEEGVIDALFNAYVMNKLNLTFEITNSSLDSLVANDSYGAWQGSARVRYLYSKDINFVGSFRYSNTETRLWGGVNKATAEAENVSIYNLDKATAVYPRTYKKNTKYHYDIRGLFSLIPDFTTEIAGYFQSDEDEFRQNETSTSIINKIIPVINDNKTYKFGTYLRQPFRYKNFGVDLISRYENTKIQSDALEIDETQSAFSVAGILSYQFDARSRLDAFSKYLIVDDISYFGFGAELNLTISDELSLYSGVSVSEKPYNLYENKLLNNSSSKHGNLLTEAKFVYMNENLNITGGFFMSRQSNAAIPYFLETDSTMASFINAYKIEDYESYGFNLSIDGKISFFEYSVVGNYFPEQNKLNVLPDFTINTGLFYVKKLFRDNLDLKAGFRAFYAGKQDSFLYDFQQNLAGYYKLNNNEIESIASESIDPYLKVDLVVSGEIQERAIIYFVIENILSSDFYTIPYYPIRKNAIRFGVSWEFYN